MTHILYFGSEKHKPFCQRSIYDDPNFLHPSLNVVSFCPDKLMGQSISLVGSSRKKSTDDYIEFMKLIDFPTLRFRKVFCGYYSIFVLDTKNELWCMGACNTGQLGISKFKSKWRLKYFIR